MEIPVSILSTRLRGVLDRSGIKTYEQLAGLNAKEVMDIPGFGKKTFLEAVSVLADDGYKLADPPEPPTPTNELTDDERSVLTLRGNHQSYVKIATRLNLSPTRVVQIEQSALRKAGALCGIQTANTNAG